MKNKKIITAVILIILLNGIALASWFYFYFTMKSEFNAIIEMRNKIVMNNEKSNGNNFLKNLMIEIADKKQKIESFFLDKQNIIKLIKELEFIAGATKTSIDIGNINTEKNPHIQFSLRGNFSQVFHYLVLLENISYVINIDKMYFQKQEKSSQAGEWRVNFEISLKGYINNETS